MTRSPLLPATLCLFLLPALSSCNLIDVTDNENSNSGRGAKVFDPYQASASGAIKLSLQMINGCAFTQSTGMIAKNSVELLKNIYPDVCENIDRPSPFTPTTGPFDPALVPPTGKLTLLANTTYFLNQISISDVAIGKHTNPADHTDFVRWLKTETHLRNLDWTNLGKSDEEWLFVQGYPGVFVDAWNKVTFFDNANWMRATDDSFTIEVIDSGGVVRTSQKYDRSEFMVGSPFAGHTRVAWAMENVAPPQSPEDTTPRLVPPLPGGFLPQVPTFRSVARLDVVGSTNPFKTFQIGELRDDGALRLTWSQLPNEPFYFPVTFIGKDEQPTTCTDDQGNAKACGFGLAPNVTMVTPANGKFFVPGETVNFFFEMRDDEGNRLHSPDYFPSPAEMFSDRANGLFSLSLNSTGTTEADNSPMITVAGPLQKMRMNEDAASPREFVRADYAFTVNSEGAAIHIFPTAAQAQQSTRMTFKVPMDATPGTYSVYVKAHRYFLGERITRLKPFFFQVGQEELTSYPARVGNCQICHRGVLSLDNLRHGLAVDHIEGCKSCHSYASDGLGRIQEMVHRIHMRSKKYSAGKNECNICHLTKESATRPSVTLCKSCHPTTHDNVYFAEEFNATPNAGRYANCAQACHGEQTPKSHILPEN